MRIQILGTAAAEGWPGIFCGCHACAKARKTDGKNMRSRASVLIDDIFKIDLPPDTYYHVVRYGLDLSRLKYLFFTHSHGDHFSANEVEYLRSPFAHNLSNAPLRIYGSQKVISAIKTRCERRELPVKLHIAEPHTPIKADGLTFIPIIARHAATELCFNYIIQSETATILYATDTGLYDNATTEFLHGFKFNLIIAECTLGNSLLSTGTHMNMRDVTKLRARLERTGAVSEHTRWVLTHLSHNIGLMHDELTAVAAKKRLEVAYDGMTIDV